LGRYLLPRWQFFYQARNRESLEISIVLAAVNSFASGFDLWFLAGKDPQWAVDASPRMERWANDHAGRYHYGDARGSSARDERRGCQNRPLNRLKRWLYFDEEQEVRALIEKIGIVPVIRTASPERGEICG